MINSELVPSETEKSKCKGNNCEMAQLLDGEGECSMNRKRLRRYWESTVNPNVVIGEKSTDESDNEQRADMENSPLTLILDNRKVLHCSMCNGQLTVPIFQCENGHLACSFCCTTLKRNECYSCQSTIGSSRCLAIEKILEIVRVKCQNSIYGCKESITYSKMHDHQMYDCYYAPCSGPVSDCKFVGTSRHLYQHVSGEHNNSVVKFQYNSFFKITVNIDENFSVLQEEKDDDVLFILNNSTESLGNLVSVCCIASTTKDLFYDIVARWITGTTLKIQSSTWSSKVRYDIPSPFGFLPVPPYMFNCHGQLELEICIWSPGETLADLAEC